MIVKSEFAAETTRSETNHAIGWSIGLPGDEIDTFSLDGFPIVLSGRSSDLLEFLCAGFTGPVSLNGFFDFTVLACGVIPILA